MINASVQAISYGIIGAVYATGTVEAGFRLNLLDTGSLRSFDLHRDSALLATQTLPQFRANLLMNGVTTITGMDQLRGRVIRVEKNRLTWNPKGVPKGWISIPMKLKNGRPTIQFTTSEGKNLKFYLDTGAPSNLIFEKLGSPLGYQQLSMIAFSDIARGNIVRVVDLNLQSQSVGLVATHIERNRTAAVCELKLSPNDQIVFLSEGPAAQYRYPKGTVVLRSISALVSTKIDEVTGELIVSRESSFSILNDVDGIVSPQYLSFSFQLDFKSNMFSFDPLYSSAAAKNCVFTALTREPFERSRGIPLSGSSVLLLSVGNQSATSIRKMPFHTSTDIKAVMSSVLGGNRTYRVLEESGEVSTFPLNLLAPTPTFGSDTER
jgi:hypothetical protein